MGVISNGSGGGAGGGIRYNAQTDMIQVKVNGQWVDTPYKAYGTFDGMLYNAGVQAVPWDNSGYTRESGKTCDGGANLLADYMTFTATTTVDHTRVIITDDKIDLTAFTSLKIIYKGTTYTSDISSLSGQYYVYIEVGRNSGGYYLIFAVTTQKTNYNSYRLASIAPVVNNSNSTSIEGEITKVWLSV